MAGNEIGGFLNITPDVLNKLNSFDEKLEKIQQHSKTAAEALKNGFSSVVVDTSKLESAITSLTNKIGALNTAGRVFDNIGYSAQQSSSQVGQMSSSISEMAQMLNRLKFTDFSIGNFSAENVAKMREAVSQIKSQLKNNTSLSDSDKSALSKEKSMYEEKLKEYQSFINIKNKIAANANAEELRQQQTTYRKMTNVMESYMKKVEEQKQRYENAMKSMADYAAQSPAQRTSLINNTLNFSANAKTLQDDVAAIKLLKEARLQLDKTDKNYQSTLNQINSAIAKHNQALTEAGVKSQQLATRHRNLMDTAGQLSRQLALLFSVSQIEGYISKLAKVRGEFELQQRSLQAILQNKSQADQIFNKTVQLAVKSPFQIKELVSYTKQLAAYRIESDKLYDTTKRLADVSAGLGVDMQRLILAYGQVKAAAYLRGTEVRQFTEAGINLYGELQRYFEEVKGEAYTTAQIVDMISKRKVTFEDIENIFKRLTDSGGLFYNMQEIQAETLQGKIANLKDSIDVMLNSIGKANEDTLKGSIDTVKVLIDNWETVVDVAKAFGVIIGAMGLTAWSKKLGLANSNVAMLGAGITRLTATMKTLKTVFVSSLPTAGIFLAIEALTELIQVYSEYNKSVSESNTKYFKNRVVLAEIDKESESDIKTALTKLVNAMNNEGFEIEIKANISEDEARKELDNYKQMYENFLYDMLVLEQKYAENKKRGWANPFADKAFVDDIDTNAKEYKESLAEFVAGGEKVRAVLLEVAEKSTILTKVQAEQFKALAAGPDKGENVINYYERLAKALEEVGYKADEAYGGKISKQNILGGEHQTKGIWGVGKELDRQMAGFSTSFITMQRDLERFRNDARSILGEVRKDMSDEEKNELKIRINALARIANWDDVLKDVVYQDYNLNLKVDSDEVEKEMDGLDKIFKSWFSKHTYKLNINYGDLGNKDGFKGFLEEGDEMAAAYKKAELSAKRLKNAADTIFNQKQSGLTKEQFQNAFGLVTETVDKKQLIKYYEELAKANKQAAIDAGWTEDEEKKDRSTRDIWSERISVLKEMQSRYEKLNQLMGENRAIEETRSAFKGALDFTQMGEVIKAEDIIPTKQGMIDALEKLLEQIPNDVKNAAKRTGLEKEIAELKIGIQQDYLKEQLDKTKQNIEDMFNGLDLHQKLKDAGLSEAEVQALFPGLAKTLDEVERGIHEKFNALRDDNGQLGETEQKDYEDALNKLNQQRVKESQDLVIELTKAYKTQLSDQLQLDRWYYEEKAKIAKANLTDEQKEQYNKNLTSQYNQKTDENTWKQFQKSDMYVSLFENIEVSSTRMLKALRDKLGSLRNELKNLPADQLKAIINQQEKIDEMIAKKNPFKNLASDAKKYVDFLRQRKELEQENIRATNAVSIYTKQRDAQSQIVEQKRQEYNESVSLYGIASKEANLASVQLATKQSKLDLILKQLAAEERITEKTAEQIRNGQKLGKTLSDKFNEVSSNLSEFSSAFPQIASDLENVFGVMSSGTKDTIDSISEIAGGLGQTAGGVGRIIASNGADIDGWIQAVGGIAKTIVSIFAIGDKKKEREIQRQIKNVELLGKKYDELKENMEAAWNSVTLHDTTKETIKNLDDQIASYRSMIKAEQDKKKTDNDRIKEWNDAIIELEKTKKEIMSQEQMDFGAIGGEKEYRSAAESFVQAWMDAFNETEDGLKSLNENFDDFIENLIVKQATMRLAQNRLKNLFEEIDKSVTESSVGGINLTKEELANIQSIGKTALKGLNEDLLALMETLGYKPNKKAELSALTQGITQVSEETASEISALLNSIRFFVSQQTTDISAIKELLDARYSLESEYSDSNPMLIELRAQTGYLEILSDRIDRVFAPSPNSKGAGLRVFIG